jgi:hypothetical protein
LQDFKDKISVLQKEKEEIFREWNELRLLNDKTEGVLTETRNQINRRIPNMIWKVKLFRIIF